MKLEFLRIRHALVIALLIALVAGPFAGSWGGPAAHAQNVLIIGYLGGPESDTANGARLAIDQVNSIGGVTAPDGTSYLLELMTLDEPPTDASLFEDVNAFTAQQAVALLGPDNGAALIPNNISGLAERGIPILTGATDIGLTNDDTSDVILRLRASEAYYSSALATYLTGDLGLTSLAVVQTGPNFSAAVDAFEAALADTGIVPAPKLELPDNTTLSQQTTVLLDANPEAVILWGTDQDASTLLRKLRAGGWEGLFAFRRAEEAARFGVLPAEMLEGIVGVTSWSYAYTDRASRNFLNDYIVAFGELPGPLAAAAYDAVWILRSSINSAGTESAALRSAILSFGPESIVGGALNPVAYGNGDLSRVVMVYRLGAQGGPVVAALFDNDVRRNVVDDGP